MKRFIFSSLLTLGILSWSPAQAQDDKFFWSKTIDNWRVFGFKGDQKLNAACVISSITNGESTQYAELVFDLTDAEVSLRVSNKKWQILMPPGVYGIKDNKKALLSFVVSGNKKDVQLPFAFLPASTAIIGNLDITKIMEAPAINEVEIKLPFSHEKMNIKIKNSKALFSALTDCIKASGRPKKKKVQTFEASNKYFNVSSLIK